MWILCCTYLAVAGSLSEAVVEEFAENLCIGVLQLYIMGIGIRGLRKGDVGGRVLDSKAVAALVACAECDLEVLEFSPSQIKLAVVGTGSAEKDQVQYMVRQLLALEDVPRPDHAADALAAAICYTTHEGFARRTGAACMAYDAPVCNVPVGKDRL